MPLLIARQPCIVPASRPSIEIALALLLGKIKMDGFRSLNQAALSCDSPPVASSTNAAFPEPGNPEYLITSRARQPAVGPPPALPWRPSLKLIMPWLPPLIKQSCMAASLLSATGCLLLPTSPCFRTSDNGAVAPSDDLPPNQAIDQPLLAKPALNGGFPNQATRIAPVSLATPVVALPLHCNALLPP